MNEIDKLYLIFISFIILDFTEPVHIQHDVDLIIEIFSSREPAYPLYRAYATVGKKTHLLVNSNAADI